MAAGATVFGYLAVTGPENEYRLKRIIAFRDPSPIN